MESYPKIPKQPRPQKKNVGYSLVEMIVVIAIVAVLGVIGLFAYQGYSSSARDSSRLSSVENIVRSLESAASLSQTFALPDSSFVYLTYSSTIIGYQGMAGTNTLAFAKVNTNLVDPLDGTPYFYNVNVQQNKAAVEGFLENTNQYAWYSGKRIPSLVENALAATANYTARYPFTR